MSSSQSMLQGVAAQMYLRNRCLSSATLPAVAMVPNISMMYFSHLCLGFPVLLFPVTIPCISVFSILILSSNVTNVFKLLNVLQTYTASSLVDEVNLILKSCCDDLSRVASQKHFDI